MEFRILGPLEVVEQGRALPLGGARQRTLLALLLTRANEVVSADRLIDELWGAEPPRSAANALQYHVSQLRKALAPQRGDRHAGTGLRDPRRSGRARPAPLRAAGRGGAAGGTRARGATSARSSRPLARAGACRPRRGVVRASRDSPPRRAPPGGARAPVRGRPRSRTPRRARRRGPGARSRAPAPRAAAGRPHASALRLGSAGRGARGLSRDPATARRRARHRAEPGPARARAGDPSP